MSTDFFDSDLRGESRGGTSELPEGTRGGDTISSRAISRLVEQKQERTSQMAGAVQEIELLRLRQRELEQEKDKLETLARKQGAYEKNKREVVEQLERSLVQLEKQAGEAMQAADVIAAVRRTFDEALQEVRLINENGWDARNFEEELNRASVIVEEAQAQYRKGLSKVSAAGWFRAGGAAAETEAAFFPAGKSLGFSFWLKAGLAFSLPLMVVVAVCFVIWLFARGLLP